MEGEDATNQRLQTILQILNKVKPSVAKLKKELANGTSEGSASSGMSLLTLKNLHLTSYTQNVLLIMLQKLNGEAISNREKAEWRTIESRTVLERIRPMEQKLRHHIEKLVKADGKANRGDDALSLKPNPSGMLSGDESDDEGEEPKASHQKPAKYVPPKLMAMDYEEETLSKSTKAKKKAERERSKALQSEIVKEMRREHNAEPEEIHDSADVGQRKAKSRQKERQAYEEKYMTRLNVSKKDLQKEKEMDTITSLSDITKFGDIRTLVGSKRKNKFDRNLEKGKKIPRIDPFSDKEGVSWNGFVIRII